METAGSKQNRPSCSTCRFGDSGAAPMRCAIREVPIDHPTSTLCANHQEFAAADPMPVGPVMACTVDGTRVAHRSPDSPAIRVHLLDLVERIDAHREGDLTFRESMAIWQLEEWKERRAYPHLDRIAAAVSAPRSRLGHLKIEGTIAKSLLDRIAGQEIPPGDHEAMFLERFTVRGRALLLSAVLVGGAAYYAAVVLPLDNLPAGTPVPMLFCAIAAIFVAAAWLAVGVFAFRRLGVPFLTSEAGSAADDGAPEPSSDRRVSRR